MMLFADVVLLALLIVVAVAVSRSRDLFGVVVLFSIYSLICASLFTLLDAPDVAITEAAVGAGMATVLMLATLSMTGRHERRRKRPPIVAAIVVTITGAMLAWGLADAPRFGESTAPAHTHLASSYVEETPETVGIPNVVTAVLASYRGYDTLGEVVVIFAAGVAVLSLLHLPHQPGRGPGAAGGGRRAKSRHRQWQDHRVLRVVAKLLLPGILMFALYVQGHGEVSPGGGFSAGLIFATGFALYALVCGVRPLNQAIRPVLVERTMVLGLLLFLGVGFAALLRGGQFLDHDVLASAPRSGQHAGILLVETSVFLTVAAVLLAVFLRFATAAMRGGLMNGSD